MCVRQTAYRTHPHGITATPGGANVHAKRRPKWVKPGDHTHPVSKRTQFGEDPRWWYWGFTTNNQAGQAQLLRARHRAQAHGHGQDRIKEFKIYGDSSGTVHVLPA